MSNLLLLFIGLSCGDKDVEWNKWKCPIQTVCTEKERRVLKERWDSRPEDYQPRTKHLKDGEPLFLNAMFAETSTYLRQHAHNPVNWHPWSDDTLKKAKEQNKPIFLSVGYSTCHWCHVMEEESFEDIEIATYLNKNYISIKIDREERPDLDAIFMQAVYSVKGRGGWPMSIWLNEDAEPFYAETYIPPKDGDRGRNVGFLTLLGEMNQLYQTNPTQIHKQKEYINKRIQTRLSEIDVQKTFDLDIRTVYSNAMELSRKQFDKRNGGRQGAPKFPSSFPLSFLFSQMSSDAKQMISKTLDHMARGGIYDQIGGGFHRYSVDARWAVPHFEKMLYDNAQLIPIYADGGRLFGNQYWTQVAKESTDYLIREMRSKEGGFFSATDADSKTPSGHMEEGYFFTWTPSEIKEIFEPEDAEQIITYFGLTAKGNLEGRNTLRLLDDSIKNLPITWTQKMYQARSKRPPPLCDQKILSGWNGLTLYALTQMYKRFGRPSDLKVAVELGKFLQNKMRHQEGLYRSYAHGTPKGIAMVEDYAAVMKGLISLFEITTDEMWLEEVFKLDDFVQKYFEDEGGGWYRTPLNGEKLLVREMPKNDGAEPSGASLMMWNLTRLYALTSSIGYYERAVAAKKRYASIIERRPLSFDMMLSTLELIEKPAHILILSYLDGDDIESYLNIFQNIDTNKLVVLMIEDRKTSSTNVPILKNKSRKEAPTSYLCELGKCRYPIQDKAELQRVLIEEKLLLVKEQ